MSTQVVWVVVIAVGTFIGNVLSFLFADRLEAWRLDREIEAELRSQKKGKKA